jgi:endonuclease III
MKSMKDAMPALTVDEVAKCDPEVLANLISNLQFYNVKARQVVQAACEIKSRFRGEVPEDQFSLTQITGIGKCFADLLAFVNTRERHTTSMNSQLVDDSFGDSNNCP